MLISLDTSLEKFLVLVRVPFPDQIEEGLKTLDPSDLGSRIDHDRQDWRATITGMRAAWATAEKFTGKMSG